MGDENSAELQAFLDKVTPWLFIQLERNNRSTSWKFNKYLFPVEDEGDSSRSIFYEPAMSAGQSVTCVTWNAIGSVIAVSYGKTFHENWCTDTASLVLWNVERKTFRGEVPDYVFETNSCANCLSFHPGNSCLLACGTFAGDVMVWTLADDITSLVTTCGGVEGGHQDAVTQLQWFTSPKKLTPNLKNIYHLVSFGADGRIICWHLALVSRDSKLTPIKIYQLSGRDQLCASIQQGLASIGQPGQLSASDPGNERPLGLATAAFSPHHGENLLIGTDSGGLLSCTFVDTDWSISRFDSCLSHKYPSPVSFVLSRFSAPVHSVSWSPFHRNLVAASGAFQGIHVFNILEKTRILTVDSGEGQIFSITFSPEDPFSLVAGSENGKVLVINICQPFEINSSTEVFEAGASRPQIAKSYEFSRGTGQSFNPITSISFNHKRSSYMAVGAGDGQIHLIHMGRIARGVALSDKVLQLEVLMKSIACL